MNQTLRRPILAETALLLMICLIDTAHTITVVRLGMAKEANPIVAWTLAHSDAMFVGFKVGLSSIALIVIEHIRPHCEPFVKLALRLGIIFYIAVFILGTTVFVPLLR